MTDQQSPPDTVALVVPRHVAEAWAAAPLRSEQTGFRMFDDRNMPTEEIIEAARGSARLVSADPHPIFDHTPTIRHAALGFGAVTFWAECSCGWVSTTRVATHEVAAFSFGEHLAAATGAYVLAGLARFKAALDQLGDLGQPPKALAGADRLPSGTEVSWGGRVAILRQTAPVLDFPDGTSLPINPDTLVRVASPRTTS